MKLDDEQLKKLRLGAITAIDGLWFLAAERSIGFEKAFELDLEVWKGYGVVQLKRLVRILGLELDPDNPPGLSAVNSLIEGLCTIDGTQCDWEMSGEEESVFNVRSCPWWDNLRRSGRHEVVNCEIVDNTIFRHWLDQIDPSLEMKIIRSIPRGDDHCSWVLTRHGGKPSGEPA